MEKRVENERILFEAIDICKNFGPTVALNHVNLTVHSGEIRGLIGENGSGKSTISSIVAGGQQPTSGVMLFNGKPHNPSSMIEAARMGIGMIVQEMGTVSGITVAQNIFLGEEALFRKYGLISKKAMNEAAKKALENIGFYDVEPDIYIDRMDLQDRKLIEIAKVMYHDPQILIVDETTTALSQKGRRIIYNIMSKMKEQGKAVLFISHDLEETMKYCDAVTVLRDGNHIATVEKSEMEETKIKKYMVGREVGDHYYREDLECSFDDKVVLNVDNITTGHGLLHNVSFQLHKGEILGVGGLSHCGMHELGRALFGEEKLLTGKVEHLPSKETIKDPVSAIRHGIGYVSKNRDMEALVLSASVRDNIVASGYDKVRNRYGLISDKAERKYVEQQVKAFTIKCASIDQNVQFLSGGNKQKVVFGKWIGRESKILILDCPTRGVDIGVKAAMYQFLEDKKKEGCSVLMISEELTELIGMSDRLLILRDGVISAEMSRSDGLLETEIIEYMI